MTLPAGGRAVAVASSTNAVMLTEYAPVTVINIGTSRVWLAADSGVGPSNGVPLDAGTSIPWTANGQLWAVLDSGASGSVTLVLTNAASDWTPSPATIAEQVAAFRDGLPLTWLSAATPGAAGGLATVTIATVTDPVWLVYRLTISCSSSGVAAFGLYAGAVGAANLRDQTSLGNANSADMSSPLQFTQGQEIIAQWSGCSAGAVGTVNLGYRVPS